MNVLKRIRFILINIVPLYAAALLAQTAPVVETPAPVVLPGQVAPKPQGPKPLIIGVDTNTPPFSILGGKGVLYGYDISMMNSLCQIMKRSCKFQPMKWIDLLPAIINNQIDFAVSSITMTPERAKVIHFSLPYGLSYSRLLTLSNTPVIEPFELSSLNDKTIGVQEGTIYESQASQIGIASPVIKTYAGDPDLLNALSNKTIDYILLDNPSALYWAANSAGTFKALGKPFAYGFGIGIAVSNANINLIPELNKALLQYQSSKDYQLNYHRFLESF